MKQGVIDPDCSVGIVPDCGLDSWRTKEFFNVRFEVFTAVTMKNVVLGDVMRFGSCKNRRFGGT
jgi:hypothetical protein